MESQQVLAEYSNGKLLKNTPCFYLYWCKSYVLVIRAREKITSKHRFFVFDHICFISVQCDGWREKGISSEGMCLVLILGKLKTEKDI